MKKGKIFKKLLAGIGITAMLFGMLPVGQAQAAGQYNFIFDPPLESSGENSGILETSGKRAYVRPSVIATQTAYCIITKREPSLKIISDHVKTGNIEKKEFTYKSGFGGAGSECMLYGNPTSARFSHYIVYGTWEA